MINFDLNVALDDPTYPGLRIVGEFLALRWSLDLLRTSVPFARDQFALRFNRDIERRYPRSAAAAEFAERREERDHVTPVIAPQYLLNPFVVSLSATIEMSMAELARYVRSKENIRFALTDLGRSPTPTHLGLYLETVYRGRLPESLGEPEMIDDLRELRNSIAHANASLRMDTDQSRVRRLRAIADKNVGVDVIDETVIVTHDYLVKALDAGTNYVDTALQFVDARYQAGS